LLIGTARREIRNAEVNQVDVVQFQLIGKSGMLLLRSSR
jgi:hypothetical protein